MNKSILKNAFVLPVAMILALQGCSKSGQVGDTATTQPPILSGKLFTNEKGELSPELRSLVKRGADYVPISSDPQALFDKLQGSMSDRRKSAWQIVERLIAPQTFAINGTEYQIPLWHTWYEGSSVNPEFYNKIDLFYSKFKACKQAASDGKCSKDYDQLAEATMNDVQGKADPKNIANTLTDANMKQMLAQLADKSKNGVGDHLGTGFTLFSPSFVKHVLSQSKGLMNCEADHAKKFRPETPPPSLTQFSPCITEFPSSGVMVKALWTDESVPNAAHDTSETAMGALFGQPSWPAAKSVPFDSSKMYSIETREGTKFGLRSIHFSTKDTREWIWVSLWWDPKPNSDFGEDRPASITGVWANYKMCVTSSFNERDPAPWKSFETSAPDLAKSIKANYNQLDAANREAGGDPGHLTTWCSNPNVETHPHNNNTNCIGCHQYAGSWNQVSGALTEFDQTFQVNDPNFPQQGRDRYRKTFLSDFGWGLALYEGIPARIRNFRKRYGIAPDE
jgi:hypothetical protein